MAEVKVQEGESIESALRRFKRKVQQEDIIKDIKKHSFYLKPGDKRRAKQALARKRSRKKQRRETELVERDPMAAVGHGSGRRHFRVRNASAVRLDRVLGLVLLSALLRALFSLILQGNYTERGETRCRLKSGSSAE